MKRFGPRFLTCLLVVVCAGLCSRAPAQDPALPEVCVTVKPGESVQAAVAMLPKGGGTVLLPPGTFMLTETLNLSYALHDRTQFSVVLRGAGQAATLIVLDTQGKPGFDFTGNCFWKIEDLHIRNRSANVGLLMARTPAGGRGCSGELQSVLMDGCYPVAAVYMTGAECVRFLNCHISNQLKKWYSADVPDIAEGEAVIMISPNNVRDIQSPYCLEGTGGGSNTEFLFHGCTISNEARGSCGFKIFGQTSDVRITSSYLHSDGLAAIYLDGTKGNVSAVSLRDCRVEGEQGRHCLYACGHVLNLTVDGGNWSSNFEPILQESSPSFTDEGYARSAGGTAVGWSIRALAFSMWDGIEDHPDEFYTTHIGFKPGETRWPDDQPYVFMRFNRLLDSVIEPCLMTNLRFRRDESGKSVVQYNFTGEAAQDIQARQRLAQFGAECRGNRITCPTRDRLVMDGAAAKQNHVTILRAD